MSSWGARPPVARRALARLGRWLALLLAIGGSGSARADAPTAPVETASEAPTALLHEAVAAYEAGDLARARTLFEAVHAAAPTARTNRSLGLVAYRQGRFEEAITYLEASLASEIKPLTPTLRADAISLRDDARAELRAANLPRPARSTEAQHAPAGEAEALAATPSATPARAPGVRTPPTHALRRRRLRRAGYTLLSVGAGALLVSLTSTALAVSRVHELESKCDARPAGGCSAEEAQALEKREHLTRLARLATAGLVLGTSSAAAGGVVLLLGYGGPQREHGAIGVAWSASF